MILVAGRRHPRPEDVSESPLTYNEVGASLSEMPAGYRHVRRSLVVGHGERDLDAAVATLSGWDVHRRAGLRVVASGPSSMVGSVVVLVVGIPGLRVGAPCRVVEVVDEPRRRGFAYGTLVGHPESGEEAFVVSLEADGSVAFTITAFSRPADLLTRVGRPFGERVQDRITTRYLRGLRDLVAERRAPAQ